MNKRLKYIGWYQIVGGAAGICLTISSILAQESMRNLTVLIVLFAIVLYSFSIYCGTLLTKTGQIEKGIKLTTINQILQVFYVSMFGVTYQYYSGLQLSLGLDLTEDFLFKFEFSPSGFDLSYGSKKDDIIVMFNIVPIIIIALLETLKSAKADTGILDFEIEQTKSTGS